MNRLLKKVSLVAVSVILLFIFSLPVHAQNSNDDITPKTQQYIDNLNEVQQAQNDGKPVNTSQENNNSGLPGFWTIVFYGFLSGVTYAFWRWVKSLKNRD